MTGGECDKKFAASDKIKNVLLPQFSYEPAVPSNRIAPELDRRMDFHEPFWWRWYYSNKVRGMNHEPMDCRRC